MPGRQAHGRPLIANPKAKAAPKRSKARAHKTALNAFNIAQEQFPTKHKRTPRARELDAEIERKHERDEGGGGGDDDDDDGGEEEGPKRKKAKGASRADDGVEFGSDSEGNEWRLGGMADDDDDSEIESDEAFGESDNEKFQGYAFRGSRAPGKVRDDDSDDGNDDEGQTLGEEAIDLATALDQFEEESGDAAEGASGSDESDEEEDDSDDDDDDDDSDADSESDEEEADPERLKELQGLISGFGGQADAEEAEDDGAPKQQKIDLGDLGLTGLSDPLMKRAVRLLKKEAKEARPGASKKLDVPLSRREQGRLDRSAAYDKTNETLDRWTETVKANRRAEHLVFPLPQESASHGVDRAEMPLVSAKTASNELEAAVLAIMEQSGLAMAPQDNPNKKVERDDEGNVLSRKQALERRRMERELHAREAKRAKRIKKIKSKAYHRVHRKQRERDEAAARAGDAADAVDSDEEREAHDRRRALERVGQRHKDSKWAKLGARTRRAVWDDDFRAGLTEMARKDEELRRRKEGKKAADDDNSSSSSSSGDDDSDDDHDDGGHLRRKLDELERDGDDSAPQSRLMAMKFMQKAEAAKKQANDELIQQIRRDLDAAEGHDDDDAAAASSSDEKPTTGRRQFGNTTAAENPFSSSAKPSSSSQQPLPTNTTKPPPVVPADWGHPADTPSPLLGAWSRSEPRRKKNPPGPSAPLPLTESILLAGPAAPPSANTKAKNEDEDDPDAHMPLAVRDQALLARAFAGEDVVAAFAAEKAQAVADDGDKLVDETLPGWGSWVGEGVSAREKQRHTGRFVTRVAGVKGEDRRDAKLDRVIINEKRVKKTDRYLASQLPHPFESRQQYERSLRLPVGPEWMTKETFQESTKPRVLMKQGIIAPISKPTA